MGKLVKAAGSATIVDVARVAGVSRQTVSNAINAPHLLRTETLAQVLAVIEQLSYRTNRNARSLRTRRSGLIGYRVDRPAPDRLNWVLDRFLHVVADSVRDAGYHLVVFTPDDEDEGLDTYAAMVRSNSVDGFLLTDIDDDDRRPGWLKRRAVPFVCYGRLARGGGQAWVDVDGAAGTAKAVEHLVEQGHQRIAFLGWHQGHRVGDDRAAGWRSAMSGHGLGNGLVRGHTEDTITSAAAAAGRLLDAAHPPSAIVGVSDTVAVGVLRAAASRGVTVGRELAVVGFDDSPSAALLTPALTSVSQPLAAAARVLVDMLLAQLDGRPATRRAVLLEPSLVIRESSTTGPLRVNA